LARKPRSTTNVDTLVETVDYRHEDKRKNIPSAQMERQGTVPKAERAKYHYNPHLPPELRFDSTGKPDALPTLIAAAQKRPLTGPEARTLSEAIKNQQPWLEWAGKREEHDRGVLNVNPVALHLHERISAKAIVRAAMRQDVERSLFAAAEPDYGKAVQFYKHDVDWANRLILGDSLEVMSSLARREGLAGQVQMIYMDPPYGIQYKSNFQPELGRPDVKDRDEDLIREAETIRAFRDTWRLGVHSYLSYLRNRFILARELLTDTGSIFVQIGDDNVHLVRSLLDDVFGPDHFVNQIIFVKTTTSTSNDLSAVHDILLWYRRGDKIKYHALFEKKMAGESGATGYKTAMLPTGELRPVSFFTKDDGTVELPEGSDLIASGDYTAQSPGSRYDLILNGRKYRPEPGYWKTDAAGMDRIKRADRLLPGNRFPGYMRRISDFPCFPIGNVWTDTLGQNQFGGKKLYATQTALKVVQRCMLMTTDPGDLVLDPTCGSGTTAFVAEEWGRRWITTDTSRVAIALARQRLLTAKYEYFKTRAATPDQQDNPARGFVYRTVPHIMPSSITQNVMLDPIFEQHDTLLEAQLRKVNASLQHVSPGLRDTLASQLRDAQRARGRASITESERRRWLLPPECRDRSADAKVRAVVDLDANEWYHWEVPFEADPSWPESLRQAVDEYRRLWKAKWAAVNRALAANSEQEVLVDDPDVVAGVTRVSGPFTVEGVIPEELALTDEGIKDLTPNDDDEGDSTGDLQNIHAYLKGMVDAIRTDGLTFPNNKKGAFVEVSPLYEGGALDAVHAEGFWSDDAKKAEPVAIAFGPQYGPITARQVEDCIHAATRYRHLVLAGFSFAPEAAAIVAEQSHPKLKIHLANIRPDMNPAMKGLLKETPNSQLFSVFGLPEIEVNQDKDGKHIVTLKGVDIFDPVENTVRSTGASKVAAWFLDTDFDNRCFCTTQAFFPNQDAWGKIAKALGSAGNEEAFEAFKGTESLPFEAGEHKRVAVKVIDPRGNEVMTVRKLS
jgi:adenine-specific DNA-methyltransferase